jgi:hypothetical protein
MTDVLTRRGKMIVNTQGECHVIMREYQGMPRNTKKCQGMPNNI